MINFAYALEIAEKHFKERDIPDILEAYETNDSFIFFGGQKEKIELPGSGIIIDKSIGDVHDFILNSRNNYGILEQAKEIEFW